MNISLLYAVASASILLISCKGKSDSLPDSPHLQEESKPLIVERDLAKGKKDVFILRVRQYDAKSLPLGEFYSKKSMLKDALLIADFTVINNAFEKSLIKSESEGYYFESKLSLFEYTSSVEVSLCFELSGQNFDSNILLQVGKYKLFEMSKSENLDRSNVYKIELERLQK